MTPANEFLVPRAVAVCYSWLLLFGTYASVDAQDVPIYRILPRTVALSGAESFQRLMVINDSDQIAMGQVDTVRWESGDPDVVEMTEGGIALAKGNGSAEVTGYFDGGEVKTSISVSNYDAPTRWSFQNHVLPVMSKAGCNQGSCHGALAGKGGFRLSLRGYDPRGDYQAITREALGRRIESIAPERSLFLTKPTMAVQHKGGRRLEPGSRDYNILASWIANGAEAPDPDEAVLDHVEVLPEHSILTKGDTQSLIVRAHYADGHVEDVTDWARLTSVDETVLQVNPEQSSLTVTGYGEGAVSVWFSSRVVIARVTSPFPQSIPVKAYANLPSRNLIDQINLQQLRQLRLLPSSRTEDSAFIRRVHLDAVGRIPDPETTLAFMESQDPLKRDHLIDQLLSSESFVDYWSYRWSDVFLVNGRLLRPKAVESYYNWVRQNVRENTPWDQWVKQVLTVQGDSISEGATNFYALHQDPETMAENVSQAFLSLSINCAKCHNHPLEKWTNDQYYGFANLFARVKAKGWGGDPRSGDGTRTLYVAERGDLIQPRTGKPQTPAPLDGESVPMHETTDRRHHLAEWITSPDNPYFTRSVVNRIWAAYFGVGLVDPVDDLRASNPASNEVLLSALAGFLVQHDFDLKSLMRLILQSETYQRSSQVLPENKGENRFYTRYYPRRLMAEVLQDAIAFVTDVADDFSQVALTDGSLEKTGFYAKGTRALELYDSSVASYFLQTFGRNERAITCECERSNQPSMVQVLHLANGDTINEKLREKTGRIQSLMDAGLSNEQLIDRAYLLCVSRRPTQLEKTAHLKILTESLPSERRLVLEDLFWALLTSREFLFQH